MISGRRHVVFNLTAPSLPCCCCYIAVWVYWSNVKNFLVHQLFKQ